MKVGIINLSVELAESYSKKLEKNNFHVVPLGLDDFEQMLPKLDAAIVRENTEEDIVQTCSLLIKLKEETTADVWVFSTAPKRSIRTVYLQLGALGVISEDCDEEEMQLIISNGLCRKANLGNNGIEEQAEELLTHRQPTFDSQKLTLIPRSHGIQIFGAQEIALTALEYRIIDLLYDNRNNVVTYEEIYERVWGKRYKNQKYRVANLVFHLREKIKYKQNNAIFIRTIRSKGYMLDLSMTETTKPSNSEAE